MSNITYRHWPVFSIKKTFVSLQISHPTLSKIYFERWLWDRVFPFLSCQIMETPLNTLLFIWTSCVITLRRTKKKRINLTSTLYTSSSTYQSTTTRPALINNEQHQLTCLTTNNYFTTKQWSTIIRFNICFRYWTDRTR